MKLGLLAASLVLVAGGAVACGGDDGGGDAKDGGDSGSKGTSKEEFCQAFQGFYDDLTSVTGTEENLGKILKDAAAKIEAVGTPDDIPDDAKKGLEQTLDVIDDLPDDASAEDISGMEGQFDEEEQANSDAFTKYLDETCPDLGADTGSDSGDDSSGGGSSDAPSDDASDDSGS